MPPLLAFAELSSLLCPLAAALWVWMLIDCALREPERGLWLCLIVVLNVPGALLYFFVRFLPRLHVAPPRCLARWVRRREIWRAEAAARNIGNAHQFVELGDLLRETGQLPRAADAYRQAIEKDGRNAPALWGAACVAMELKRFDEARDHLATVLEIDRDYKLGDASVAYGRALLELGDLDGARRHLEQHLERRDDAEPRILLATVLTRQGDAERARTLVEPLVDDLKSVKGHRARRLRSRAARLLRRVQR